MSRATQLAWVHLLAQMCEYAAEKTNYALEYARLCETISIQERRHRRGSGQIRGFSIAQATDYFVVKTIYAGLLLADKDAPISCLVGHRSDYVQAAILCADIKFRTELLLRVVERTGNHSLLDHFANIENVDYTALLGKDFV